MNINWYPGHMAKTRKMITENLKLVDAILEILDARIPFSSKNPDLDFLCQNKPKIVILNKEDMADKDTTEEWVKYYKERGILAIPANCETGEGLNTLSNDLKKLLKDKLQRNDEKGIFKAIRLMVVGIPNSGKSSFINRMAKRQSVKTENRPGVTVRKQWVKVSKDIELLDTPGILWPKFDSVKVSLNLAFTGGIKHQILDIEELGSHFIEFMLENHKEKLVERYKIEIEDCDDKFTIYDKIAFKRGYIFKKDDPDYSRCANALFDDFKNLKLGRISLESPSDKDFE
jgi:ribosome biogenesis GTPase A